MSGLLAWWRSGSDRTRLRRKLFVFSAPVLLVLLAVAVKLITMVVLGRAVVGDFARHDIEALRTDISVLSIFNVIEPGKVFFAEGDLRVLEGRLTDAETSFLKALERTGQNDSCPVRINLELVRETLGDLASRSGDKQEAENRYRSALEMVRQAPPGCFADNDDPNDDRRKIRHDAEPRLLAKIESLHNPPPPTESDSPPTVTSQPPPPSGANPPHLGSDGRLTSPPPSIGPTGEPDFQLGGDGGGDVPVIGPNGGGGNGQTSMNDVSADRLPTSGAGRRPGHQLKPGSGDPLEQLQEVLENSNASGDNQE